MPRERAVAFVVARLSSSRLPAKQLREVGGRSILTRILDELKTCRELDLAVIATVNEPENEPLRDYAAKNGVPLFWYEGDVNHVTTRLANAAKAFGAEICLLISADCPLVHAPSIDELITRMRSGPEVDAMTLPARADGAHCLLEGVHIGRIGAWLKADQISDRPELKEHQFPALYRRTDLFKIVPATLSTPVYGQRHRMSVDTWADLEFMETLYEKLAAEGKPFTLPEAVALMEREPAVKEINAHVHQRALIENVKKALIIADAGGPYGYGHFMRMRELAGQITERASWPVTFLLDDAKAEEMARASGFKTLYGAFARQVAHFPGRTVTGAPEASKTHDLVVIDVSARRLIPSGWRTEFPEGIKTVFIDRADLPALEADLAIFPGVTGRPPLPGVKVAGGSDYAIIRREVRRYAGLNIKKDIDLLFYLATDPRKDDLLGIYGEMGLNVVDASGFTDGFPRLLARSKVFLSGFGQSFYEALHLGALPVARPLSPLHEADAKAFYAAYGLEDHIIGEKGDGKAAISTALEMAGGNLPRPADGTPKIVERLKNLTLGQPGE